MYPAPPVTRMFNATSSTRKRSHEAGSHTALSAPMILALQRTPEFYTIAKTRGNCLRDASILAPFNPSIASVNNAARVRDTAWLKCAAVSFFAPNEAPRARLPCARFRSCNSQNETPSQFTFLFRPASVELRPLFWPLPPDSLIGYLPAVPRVLKPLSSRKLLPTMLATLSCASVSSASRVHYNCAA